MRDTRLSDTEEILRWYMEKPAEIRSTMEKHNIKIDDLNDKMQKFAFTLYSDIVQGCQKATNYFERHYDKEEKK